MTNIDLDELFKKAKSIGIDLEDPCMTCHNLGIMCDNLNRNVTIPYPRKEDFTTFYAYLKGKVVGKDLTIDEKAATNSLNPGCLFEPHFDELAFNVARKKYYDYTNTIARVFHDGILFLCGVHTNPKAEKAYSMAYDRGHSAGFGEVAGYFDELVELIK